MLKFYSLSILFFVGVRSFNIKRKSRGASPFLRCKYFKQPNFFNKKLTSTHVWGYCKVTMNIHFFIASLIGFFLITYNTACCPIWFLHNIWIRYSKTAVLKLCSTRPQGSARVIYGAVRTPWTPKLNTIQYY